MIARHVEESKLSRVALHLGDCVPALGAWDDKRGLFDLVVADPPYSSGSLHAGQRRTNPSTKYVSWATNQRRKWADFAGDNRDQRSWRNWCYLWLSAALAASREGAYVAVFTDWRELPTLTDSVQGAGWIWRGIIAWDKGEGARAPHKGYCRHQCEYIVWGTKGPCPPATHGGPLPGCLRHRIERDRLHMTSKPVALLRELVCLVPPGSLVCDPFAGSGSTAVACLQAGHDFVGWEIDPQHHATAMQRLRGVERRDTAGPRALVEQRPRTARVQAPRAGRLTAKGT